MTPQSPAEGDTTAPPATPQSSQTPAHPATASPPAVLWAGSRALTLRHAEDTPRWHQVTPDALAPTPCAPHTQGPQGLPTRARVPGTQDVPGGVWWAGFIAYEVGRTIEPTSLAARPGEPVPPASWDGCGPGSAAGALCPGPWGLGAWCAVRPACGDAGLAAGGAFSLGPLRSDWGRAGYQAAVAHAVELIGAGELYQVNLAHHLVGRVGGDSLALFATLADRVRPAFGCLLELPALPDGRRRWVACLSPELLVSYDAATRRLVCEPMKGTRPATPGAGAGPDPARAALEKSVKDRAELAMIVDLTRNDLGRVARGGSVRVDEPRRIERHGGALGAVWQASARVSATLADGLTLDDALRALLPAGSITGAPKVRAMQVINRLEPAPRGPYCGAIGVIDPAGGARLAVGIRTACVVGDELRYPVGAGVVADSTPGDEWLETLAKAGPLRAIGARVIED